MGFSELIIILVIVFIIFGAGRLPQIGEGVGKALRGFKKEVNDVPQPTSDQPLQETPPQQPAQISPEATTTRSPIPTAAKANTPYIPGPELTPGTTASFLYTASTQTAPASIAPSLSTASSQPSQVVSMEERAANPGPISRTSYPSLPTGAQTRPATKRPSAIVNQEAVARVQAQQAALKAKASSPTIVGGVSPDDLQNLGEGLGEVVRTFRQAVTDIRSNVDPQLHTIQAEVDAAQKEIQQSIEAAKELPSVQDESPKSS